MASGKWITVGPIRFNTVDFLVGGAGSGSTNDLTITLEGELGIV